MTLHAWLKSATHPATMRRAGATSLMVGTVLIAINHGHAVIAGQITQERIFQMFLTVIIPYIVSTVSSVATRHELRQVRPVGRKNLRIHRGYGARELVAVAEKCDA